MNFYGNSTSLILVPGGNFHMDGLAGVIDQTYTCLNELALSLAPGYGAGHPVFGVFRHDVLGMKISFGTIWATLSCQYRCATYGTIVGAPTASYELVGGLSTEPIETHPSFVSGLGGTPTSPLNGAVFDPVTGLFKGFPVTAGMGLGQTRSYLAPSLTWRETKYSGDALTGITSLGKKIDPTGPIPDTPDARDWLVVGYTQRIQGSQIVYTQEFRLSGPNGWNDVIYDGYGSGSTSG